MELASAYRRQKRDFVTVSEFRVPPSKFLIASSDQRIAKTEKLRESRPVRAKKVIKRGAFGDLLAFFGDSAEFTDTAEEQYLYTNCGRDGCHSKIVT